MERDARSCGACGAPALGVLRDVQRAYQDRLELVDRIGGSKKLQMKVQVLESWVSDLVAQNTLLASTVEELETEVTSRLLEKRRHAERDKNKMICDKVNEMKVKNDSLKKENLNKDREIRRLNKDLQHYEQTIMSLRNELSMNNYHTPDVPKKDAEVMADLSNENRQECDDVEPVKESGQAIEEHPVYQERMQQLEHSAKLNSEFRSLRHENVALREKLSAMQRVCVALDEQCHVAALRAQFKDDVIHEMRRQLRQAKAKLKEVSESKSINTQKDSNHEIQRKTSSSYDSLNMPCVQQQPRKNRRVRPDMDPNAGWERNSAICDGSGDDGSLKAE